MPKIERALLVAQPMLFGVGVMFSRFVTLPTTPGSLVRPLVVVLAAAAILLLLARVLTRSWTWAAILSSLVLLFTLRDSLPAGVFAAIVVWWLLVLALRRLSGRPPPPGRIPFLLARATAIYSLAFLLATGWSAWAAANTRPVVHAPEYSSSGGGGPNIYLLLLDGYPRADTLRETFSIDNSAFLEDLEDEGFSVSEDARSNYNKTWLTLASMFNGAYIDELIGDQQIPADDGNQIRWLSWMIDEASILEVLRDRGYVIRTLPPPFRTTSLTSADEYIDHGHLTEFEAKILWSSPLVQFFRDQTAPLFLSNQEDHVRDSFSTMVQLARSPRSEPQFVFAHIHSPHTPFVLHPPSEPAFGVPDCFPLSCSLWHATIEELQIEFPEYREGLRQQLVVLNGIILTTVEQIAAADPEAVVILMSDHGIRYSLGDTAEHFKSFLAARTPGVANLFPEDESPVNVLRRLFSAYFGSDLEALPYRAWESNWYATLQLTPVEPD